MESPRGVKASIPQFRIRIRVPESLCYTNLFLVAEKSIFHWNTWILKALAISLNSAVSLPLSFSFSLSPTESFSMLPFIAFLCP